MSRQSEIRKRLNALTPPIVEGIVFGVATISPRRVFSDNAPSDLRYLLDRLEMATRLLQLAREELAVGRRFLPMHGSFGEEGIDNYEYTQRVVEQFLKESQ